MQVPLAAGASSSWCLAKAGSTRARATAVEGQVPGREPRVLPGVGHGDDVRRRRGATSARLRPRRCSPVGGGVAGRRGLSQRSARRSGRTAWTTAGRRTAWRMHRGLVARSRRRPGQAPRRTRRLPPGDPRRLAPGGVQAVALRRQAQADLGRPSARHGDAIVQRPFGAGAAGVRRCRHHARRDRRSRPWGNGSRSPPKSRALLVSLSHISRPGSSSPARTKRPSEWCWATRRTPSATLSNGRRSSRPHDHVLRNHSVGSTSMVCSSGAALRTVTRMHRSSGAALA